MPFSSEISDDSCACRSGRARTPELPQSLLELQLRTDVVALGDTLEGLALRGTQLETALISTQNETSFISGQGGYGRFMGRGEPWRPLQNRVNLRVSEGAPLNLSRGSGRRDEALPLSVVASDATGKIIHRVQAQSSHDQRLVHSIDVADDDQFNAPQTSLSPNFAPNIIPFTAIRKVRTAWSEMRIEAHLNDLLVDNGEIRQRSLPHVGRNLAWKILPSIVPSFLAFLSDRSIPVVCGVVSQGLLQAACSEIVNVTEIGDLLIASGENSNFVMNLKEQSEIWVLASGNEFWIECYAPSRGIQSVILRDPMSPQSEWRDYLASLPGC
jgi:hypothetical protein